MDLPPKSMVFLLSNINILQCECSFAMIIQDFNDQIDSFFLSKYAYFAYYVPFDPRGVNI